MVHLVPRVLLAPPDLLGKMETKDILEYRDNKDPLESLASQELKERRERWVKKVVEDIKA